MKITASDGTQYRVQFVHSAHDPKHPVLGVPGGLRQMVDHLAASLRRRITLCEISVISGTTQVSAETGEDYVAIQFSPVAYGYSVCHYFDQFVKAVGRGSAFERALRVSGLDDQTKLDLIAGLGYEVCSDCAECAE